MSFTNQVDLSVLLQNTAKPVMDYVDRSTTKAVDVSKLDVCFGGFTPMALSDGSATREQVLQAEKRERLRREAADRAAAIEFARMSEERNCKDEDGTVWTYVLLDDAEARITGCLPGASDIRIPETLEGKPVTSLAPDACAFLKTIESVSIPDCVMSVGYSAFRNCMALRSIVFPENLGVFDVNWLRNCNALEQLWLPGQLDRIDSRLFDLTGLKELHIGPGTAEILPGAFQKSKLERVEVSKGNASLSTDGKALYLDNGSILLALAVPAARYEVASGCRAIAKKGFSNFDCLEEVVLPDTVEAIGDFAYANTSITSFSAPAALKAIGEKAFFQCSKLASVTLNEGLVEVRDNAFSSTALMELRLPASVERVGNPLASGTQLTYVGDDATFSIAEGSDHLSLDKLGCLYRNTSEGYVLDRMMNPRIEYYAVREGTVAIGCEAFASHPALRRVQLPEGVTVVGRRAFKACRKLEDVNIPDTLAVVEEEAFLDTELRRLVIPEALESIGGNALVTYGAHHGSHPSLRELEVDPANPCFYKVDDMLLERRKEGRVRLLLCLGAQSTVAVPQEVTELAPYAFNGVSGVDELCISDRVTTVGMRALGFDCLIPHMVLDLDKPIEGHTRIELDFPGTDRSAQQQMLALSVPDHVNVRAILEHYDTAIINASSFDALYAEKLPLYDQATRLVARLKDPIFLSDVNRAMCNRVLETSIGDICVEAAKHDDRRLVDDLLNMGLVNNDNINEVIDRVGAVQDASMTGYLLEAKRERFGMEAFDFDL